MTKLFNEWNWAEVLGIGLENMDGGKDKENTILDSYHLSKTYFGYKNLLLLTSADLF